MFDRALFVRLAIVLGTGFALATIAVGSRYWQDFSRQRAAERACLAAGHDAAWCEARMASEHDECLRQTYVSSRGRYDRVRGHLDDALYAQCLDLGAAAYEAAQKARRWH